MVKQGDIIKINLDPTKGHEQGGWRPALIISNNEFIKRAKMVIVLPITSNPKKFPLHVPLDQRTKTIGKVLCEHIRSLDLEAREYEIIEQLPEDILKTVLAIIEAEMARE